MSRSVYVAGGIGHEETIRAVQAAFREAGWRITYDWTVHGSLAAASPERRAQAAVEEFAGVAAASILVARLPGYRGTHVEIGIALGLGKPVLLVADDEAALSAGYAGECAFYRHPNVRIVIAKVSPTAIVELATHIVEAREVAA